MARTVSCRSGAQLRPLRAAGEGGAQENLSHQKHPRSFLFRRHPLQYAPVPPSTQVVMEDLRALPFDATTPTTSGIPITMEVAFIPSIPHACRGVFSACLHEAASS